MVGSQERLSIDHLQCSRLVALYGKMQVHRPASIEEVLSRML